MLKLGLIGCGKMGGALLRGVEKLARAVKATLGPAGRNVILDKGYGGPRITNDGVSIAKDIELSDPYERIGAELARESGVRADVIVPVPDSGVPAAMGYASESGIPFELGIIRNHYVGRTFIEPTQTIRSLGVKLKHNANRAVVQGKRVVLIDDSIVRGTTSFKIVKMMREAGAREMRRHSCE